MFPLQCYDTVRYSGSCVPYRHSHQGSFSFDHCLNASITLTEHSSFTLIKSNQDQFWPMLRGSTAWQSPNIFLKVTVKRLHTVQCGSGRGVNNSFFLVSGEENDTKEVWLARALTLLKQRAQTISEPADFAFIPFLKCPESSYEVGKELGVCLVDGPLIMK